MTATFSIKGTLPGLNEVTRANRTHWSVGAKLKLEAEKRIGWYIREAKLEPVKAPVHVEIAWYEPNRRRDVDNITSAVKFVLDALVREGVLQDDSQRWVRAIAHFICIDHEHPRVVVTLTEEE